MSDKLKSFRVINAAGGDTYIIPATGKPKQRRAAILAKSPFGGIRRFEPFQPTLFSESQITAGTSAIGGKMTVAALALAAVAGHDMAHVSGN